LKRKSIFAIKEDSMRNETLSMERRRAKQEGLNSLSMKSSG